MTKPYNVLLAPTQGVNHPFVQLLHTVDALHTVVLSSRLGRQIYCHSVKVLVFKAHLFY